MPRASRYLIEGYVYHLTHRCHDRRFLLKFKQERELYREWLRIGAQRYNVSIYAYCITCNHTHIVVQVDDREAVARLMQLPSGVVAKALNQRKGHGDAVWEHPYQCTMVENGPHLLRCLRYVDLNMVRAGKIMHPNKWRWCGYDELTGRRHRYQIVDVERLAKRLEISSVDSFFELHYKGIEEQLQLRKLEREAHWTEALAVGSHEFIAVAASRYQQRQKLSQYPVRGESKTDAWALRESGSGYNTDSVAKTQF